MKNTTVRQLLVLALLLLVFCGVWRLAAGRSYTLSLPLGVSARDIDPSSIRVAVDSPGVVRLGELSVRQGRIRVPVHPQSRGSAYLELTDGSGEALGLLRVDVSPLNTVFDAQSGGFTGDTGVLIAVTAFFLLTAAVMLRAYRLARGPAFYSYGTIYAAGFSLFSLITGLVMLYVTVSHLLYPYDYPMLSAYSAVSQAGGRFMLLTAPFLIAFALALAVSNLALWRHEGFRPKNALGMAVGLVLITGEIVGFFLYSRDFSGSLWEYRLFNTAQNVYAAAFAYFECMLIGAAVCGLKAARHTPSFGRDYILILGCRFRKDGTLTPLLQGRVDRALSFWRAQLDQTGRRAVLVPSGGRGIDEPISEAEAMKRYLLSKGIPEDCVLPEDKSRNTLENMRLSRALLGPCEEGRVAFATTGYHVFRSGLLSAQAGLSAEGMGSRTRWWYWPNAFMRECAGLLLAHLGRELLLLAAMIAFFAALSMVVG